jgi:hypothetical protein
VSLTDFVVHRVRAPPPPPPAACRYYAALAIALAINLVLFFSASVDVSSSVGCSGDVTCRWDPFFHWISQSWSPYTKSRVFGLVLPGPAALAVRVLTILHFFFSSIMFVGWLVCGTLMHSHLHGLPGAVHPGCRRWRHVMALRGRHLHCVCVTAALLCPGVCVPLQSVSGRLLLKELRAVGSSRKHILLSGPCSLRTVSKPRHPHGTHRDAMSASRPWPMRHPALQPSLPPPLARSNFFP